MLLLLSRSLARLGQVIRHIKGDLGAIMVGANSSSVRLLSELMTYGPRRRAELARRLGVSRATISNVVAAAREAAIVEEVSDGEGSARMRVGITLDQGIVASLVIHRAAISVALSSLDGRMTRTAQRETGVELSARERLQAALDLLDELRVALPVVPEHCPAILCHVAVPTQCDAETGRVFPSPASQAWIGVNPKTIVSEALGCPVIVQNTARLYAYTEHLAHERPGEQPPQSTCYVALNEGVAMGLVVDGVILGGANGGSGELGHTVAVPGGAECECGNHGCLMQYLASHKLEEQVRSYGDERPLAELLDLPAKRLDQEVVSTFESAGHLVGLSLANLANLLDPALMVIGGDVGQPGGVLWQELCETLERNTLPLVATTMRVEKAKSSRDLEVVAAAAVSCLRRDEKLVASLSAQLIQAVREA